MSVVPDLDGPSAMPPPGVVPQLDNPPNNNALALGVLVTCVVVPTISVFIRIYQRVLVQKRYRIEEAMTVLAYALFCVSAASMFVLIGRPGYYVHTWDIRMRDLAPTAMWILVMGTAYALVMPLIKTAILIEWCGMFVPHGRRQASWFWWGAYILIGIQTVAGVIFAILLNVRCTPHAATYDPFIAAVSTCLFKLEVCQLGSGIVQVVCDVIMFLLPQPIIWGLQMDWKKRLGISVIFGAGLLACISAVARLYYTVAYVASDDPMYQMGPPIFWVAGEMACGFFIHCVPCLPKFVRETGIQAVARKILSLPSTARGSKGSSSLDYDSKGNSGVGVPSSHSHSTKLGAPVPGARSYIEIDEEGLPLEDIKNDSTERLREGSAVDGQQNGDSKANSTRAIVLTTHVTVREDPNTLNENLTIQHQKTHSQWARK